MSVQPRGDKYRAIIRRRGVTVASKTFRLKEDAEKFERSIRDKLDRAVDYDYRELNTTTVADLLTRFRDEVAPHRKGWRFETNRINAYLREDWVNLRLSEDIPGAIRAWRDARVKDVSPHTVIRDFSLLGSVFTTAIKEWGIGLTSNPIHRVQRPKLTGRGERDQTWSEADLALFLQHYEFHVDNTPKLKRDYVPWVLLLARTTGLRLGEICRIEVSRIDLSVPCISFDTTKNGDAYHCPLRSDAKQLVEQLLRHRQGQDRLIPVNAEVIGQFFIKARKEIAEKHPHVAELVIHSLRHTFTTQMASKIKDPLTLMRITGRRSIQSLARYYRPKASDLALLMG